MAEALGDVIASWITHNEPWGVAFVGHAEGTKAPGLRDWPTALRVAHHLLVSHGLAVRALRASRPDATVGISLNLAPVRPASASAADAAAARRRDGYVNRWFLDPLLRGAYPGDMVALFERRVGLSGAPGAADLATIGESIDFLGIDYHPEYVRAEPKSGPLGLVAAAPPPPTSALGWSVDPPAGLRELLGRLVRDWPPAATAITENGVPRTISGRQRSRTPERVSSLTPELFEALGEAVGDGADVRRYHVWSLLDNPNGSRIRGAVRARARRLRDATPHAQAQRPAGTATRIAARTVTGPCPGAASRGRPLTTFRRPRLPGARGSSFTVGIA